MPRRRLPPHGHRDAIFVNAPRVRAIPHNPRVTNDNPEPHRDLRMGLHRFDAVPDATSIPDGYELRTYRPGDEPAWIALLETGQFQHWDNGRLQRMIEGDRAPLPLDGVFFLTRGDVPVASACTFLYDGIDPPGAEVGWVVVAPEHRGRGLGFAVSAAVVRHARDLGYNYIFLNTEDFRPAAIKTYLRLGFQPEFPNHGDEAWWQEFMARNR